MQKLNYLFNQIFKTSNENYTTGKEAIADCYKKFSILKEKDNICFKVFLYFFPVTSTSEKNTDNFWFVKYKNDKEYDEFDLAEDLLQSYFEYSCDKNKDNFESKIKNICLKFNEYKLFPFYILSIQGYQDNLMATVAYFTKDSSYYKEALNTHVSPNNIQTFDFILNIKELLTKKMLIFELINKVESLKKQLSQISSEKKETHRKNDNNKNKDLEIEIKNLSERLTKLEDKDRIRAEQIKNIQEDNIKLSEQILDLQKDKQSYIEENQRLKDEIEQLNSKIEEISSRYNINEH